MRVPPVLMVVNCPSWLAKALSAFLKFFTIFLISAVNGICILAFRSLYENTISLLFHEKIITYHCGGNASLRNHVRLFGLTVRYQITGTHYSDVIMSTISSLISSLTIVYSTVYSDADQRKHQSPASLAFVRGIHRRPVNSPHKWPVTRKMFPFDDVIMDQLICGACANGD